MDFDLCVPAHNEAEIIVESLTSIAAAFDALLISTVLTSGRIMLVDNASTDDTTHRAKDISHPHVTIIRLDEKGKGRAIIEAARRSTSGFFGFIDADLSADPEDIALLLSSVIADEADICIGSRLLNTNFVERSVLRSATSRIFNTLRHILLGINVIDSQCGLKVMNAKACEILKGCQETGWFVDLEFLAKAEHSGLRIREVPIHWNEQRFSGRQSTLRIVRDGFGAVNAMVRIRARLRT